MKIRWIFRGMIVIGAIGVLVSEYELRHIHKDPPPGWTIVTDGEGHYGCKWPDSDVVIDKDCGWRMRSRQAAINRAWDQVEWQQKKDEQNRKWKTK